VKKLILIIVVALLAGSPLFQIERAAAQPDRSGGACAQLTAEHSRSAACDAEMSANPLPDLVRPVTYREDRDGLAIPRSFLFPAESLPYPVAWQHAAWYFSDAPGDYAEDNYSDAHRIGRETMYYVYHSVMAGGEVWHLIGPGQWMRGVFVSVLQIPARPEGVAGQWVALDLYQGTLVAFEDDMPVFATLISAGYYLQTTQGLFRVYARTLAMQMQGPPGANPPLYSFPTNWVLFFNEHQGLHAMPFHNDFGTNRTHGCVNVPPGDEEWLWNFLDETADQWDPDGTNGFFVENPERAPWVYVYESAALPVWE
jgi:hypothetical protein